MFFCSYNMRMSSDMSKRRVPQQERGERRVAALLEAAAAVIAEVGYETATMTAIAERAGASIGAVYQYFPNKEAVVHALRVQYGNEMRERLQPLTHGAAALSVRELVDGIFEVMVDFMENRPAYIPLLSAPVKIKRDVGARNRLREHFAALFREKQPGMSHEEAFRVANVTFQVVKGMSPLYIEAKPEERGAVAEEFRLALTAYLSLRLGG
jgi:AcrR family transcriptional regulator